MLRLSSEGAWGCVMRVRLKAVAHAHARYADLPLAESGTLSRLQTNSLKSCFLWVLTPTMPGEVEIPTLSELNVDEVCVCNV